MSLENILNWGKRTVSVSLVIGAVAAGSALIQCNSDNSGSKGISEIYGLEEYAGVTVKLPIWSPDTLEINMGHTILTYSVELYDKPKFYKGPMPLEYNRLQTQGMGYLFSSDLILAHEFDEFSNYFIYENSTFLSGAVSLNRNNELVAEARIKYSDEKGIILKYAMEEFHYDEGRLIFHCFSQIDMNSGMKISEINRTGKKKKEYYFIVPTNNQ